MLLFNVSLFIFFQTVCYVGDLSIHSLALEMASGLNKVVRYLTKIHDKKNDRKNFERDRAKGTKLCAAELQPSALLAFSRIEQNDDESRTIQLLCGIFKRDNSLKNQFGEEGENLLYCACRWGRLKVAEFLLDNGLDPKLVTRKGTALHGLLEAYKRGRISATIFIKFSRHLCARGCDVDAVNCYGMSPFLCAVETAQIVVIRALIDLKCNYNITNATDDHAFHFLVRMNAPAVLSVTRYLLTLPGIGINVSNAGGAFAAEDLKVLCDWNSNASTMLMKQHHLAMFEALMQAGEVIDDCTIEDNVPQF